MHALPVLVQIILQVQPLSSVPVDLKYKGFLDALRRIPAREGGWQVQHTHTPEEDTLYCSHLYCSLVMYCRQMYDVLQSYVLQCVRYCSHC